MRKLTLAITLSFIVACDDENPTPSTDQTCTVTANADGSSTVTCGDQSVIVNQPEAADPSTVIRTADEPAGDNCDFGGKRIEAGRDANGNTLLDDDERESTAFLCDAAPTPTPPRVLEGDFVISDYLAAVVLSQFDELHGDLLIASYSPAQLPPMRLRRIEGDFAVLSNGALASLDAFTDLTVTGNIDLQANPALTTLGAGSWQASGFVKVNGAVANLEALAGTTAPQAIYFDGPVVSSLTALRNLRSVGDLVLANMEELASMAGLRSDLTISGELRLVNDESLATLDGLPAVSQLGSLRLINLSDLTSAAFPALTTITSDLEVSLVPNLSSFSAPLLHTVGDDLTIEFVALTDLSLPSLVRAVDVTIQAATTLPACDFYDLLDQLSPPATTSTQSGLDEPCVPNPCAGACTRDCSVASDYVCL